LQIGNWVETRQNCLALSPILFTSPTRTRQDKTVLSITTRTKKSLSATATYQATMLKTQKVQMLEAHTIIHDT